MSVEREMSLAEWCAKLPNQHKVNQELAVLNKQLAFLAEQNEKLKEAINLIYSWANNWESEFMNDPDWKEQDYPFIQSTISLPDLASPVLNRIRAEGMRMAADICSEKHSLSGAEEANAPDNSEPLLDDPCAATRRAITRAAAEIQLGKESGK